MRIAVISEKGGVGKSTLALSIAWQLHARRARVLLVDTDPQGTCREAGELAARDERAAPTVASMGPELHRKGQLDRLAAGFDHVVIDTPGAAGDLMKAALIATELALLPVSPGGADLWALDRTFEVVAAARRFNAGLRVAVVLTRMRPNSVMGREAYAELERFCAEEGVPLLKTVVHQRDAWGWATTRGIGVVQAEPRSAAANELRHLLTELTKLTKGKR